jgi:hypothetical protein
MSKPVSVSQLPDEIVVRPYKVKKMIPGLFDRENVRSGRIVNVRRSPFVNSPRSYWIEETDGRLLSILTETRLRECLEEVKS